MENKARIPWIAGVLTLLTIGLGHLYCGKVKRGAILFLGAQFFLVMTYSSFLFYAPFGPILAIVALLYYAIYCILDSVRVARRLKTSYSLKKYNKWYVYLLCWFVATFVVQGIVEATAKDDLVQSYKIPSGAMKPTIQIGDYIMAEKFEHRDIELERGDIVVFPFPEDPSKDFIKRIVGMGGDSFEIRDKQVFINGDPYEEPYKVHNDSVVFPRSSSRPRDNFGPVKVPGDSLFVLGDNRDASYDSRFWGFVKTPSVKGKAVSIYWSWDKDRSRVRWNRIGNTIR